MSSWMKLNCHNKRMLVLYFFKKNLAKNFLLVYKLGFIMKHTHMAEEIKDFGVIVFIRKFQSFKFKLKNKFVFLLYKNMIQKQSWYLLRKKILCQLITNFNFM